MDALGISRERSTSGCRARLMLEQIGHPFARMPVATWTFENVQAVASASHCSRSRTCAARSCDGQATCRARARLHQAVRCRRPHVALQRQRVGAEDVDPAPDPLVDTHGSVRRVTKSEILERIVATRISPESVPGSGRGRSIHPLSSFPYDLQDFHLRYYVSRFGYRPSKVAFLHQPHGAIANEERGPDTVPDERREYGLATIRRWLECSCSASSGQPVQALGDAERSEGGFRRLVVSAQRLACAQRFARDGLDRGAARQRAGAATRTAQGAREARAPLTDQLPACPTRS